MSRQHIVHISDTNWWWRGWSEGVWLLEQSGAIHHALPTGIFKDKKNPSAAAIHQQ